MATSEYQNGYNAGYEDGRLDGAATDCAGCRDVDDTFTLINDYVRMIQRGTYREDMDGDTLEILRRIVRELGGTVNF